jgi:signal transduction histidine kinase
MASTPSQPVFSDAALVQAALPTARLEQINALATVARMVAALAHELNNSLQVIGGLVELLADRPDLPVDAAIRIHGIGEQTDRASALIRQVLGYARDSGSRATPTDLGALVDRAVAFRAPSLARSGVTVDWTREADEVVRVSANEGRLQQVVTSLLLNAEEAVSGQSCRRVRLVLTRAAGIARLSVADSGPGVPEALRARIFDPFFTTRASAGAIGLGLTASAAIAAAHGGRLWLDDAGPGATFVFELPLANT